MSFYFFYQKEEKSKWFPALASERENLIKTRKPALVSVLNVDNCFDHDLSLEETRALRYEGPFYVDFDGELDEVTEQVKKFLLNLKARDVNLDMLRIFATGGRGYHIEIPAQMFMGKIPANGIPFLPDIYREVAHSLYVDTMDLRIYTARRGRMWRCVNVLRDNGKYKVQISAEEALSMTLEKYAQFCSSPRNSLPTEPPSIDPELGLLFAQAKDKVDAGVARKKAKKQATDVLKRFEGKWPDTLDGILKGAIVKPGVGWNHLSMQLAITASELGKNEEQLLEDAADLINSHESDSTRYNTPSKRRQDLREMFRYIAGNPCYEFSVGAILSLVRPDVRANADITFGDWAPSEAAPVEMQEGVDPAAEDVVADSDDGPIRIDRTGIYVRGEHGYRRVCDIGFTNLVSMRKMDDTQIGYEADITLDNKSRGRKHLPMSAFSSRSQFHNWALTIGASMKATDSATAALVDVFRIRAAKLGEPTYALEREGVDVILPPGSTDPDKIHVAWVSPAGVITNSCDVKYRFHGHYSEQGMFKTDLMNATDLVPEDRDFFDDLLTINSTNNLAKLLGFFSACFLTQIIRRQFKKYPILQVFGQAEAGKSATIKLLANMHYFLKSPKTFSVAGMTAWPIIAATATSASIPVIFEEMKPRQIKKELKDLIQGIFRSNYTADELNRGGIARDSPIRALIVNDFANAAPICFVGEAIEDQSAILARCVVVALNKTDRKGKREQFDRCQRAPHVLGKLGKKMALAALLLDRKEFADYQQDALDKLCAELSGDRADDTIRSLYNQSVCVTGLEFLRRVLGSVYGTHFDERIEDMKQTLFDRVSENVIKNMAEASRVLDTMASLSRSHEIQVALVHGVDYTLGTDGTTMDLKVKPAYAKYVRYQRSLGMEVLFDSESAFIMGLANYAGTVSRACPDNDVLFDSPKAVVYRLSLDYLDKEGVDTFKS